MYITYQYHGCLVYLSVSCVTECTVHHEWRLVDPANRHPLRLRTQRLDGFPQFVERVVEVVVDDCEVEEALVPAFDVC